MGKGRYLKSAERACAAKARFATAQEAERTADYRFGAYLCPVCHHYHLTSSARPVSAPEPAPKPAEVKGPKLGDLDWSAALEPGKPKPGRPPKPVKPKPPPPPPTRVARCAGPCGKDGRVPIILDGRLVKSRRIGRSELRAQLVRDVEVRVGMEDPPEVLGLA